MPTTGSANRLLPALKRVVLARDAADRTDGYLLSAYVTRQDADAFAGLVKRHGPMVLGVCRRVVGEVHTADDAFQAVFLVLARRAAVVKPREQVGNWLYGVAYRTAIKARAVLARRRSREKQVETMPEPQASCTPDIWSDLQPVIDEELARLPDKLRVPVVLCDLEGRPQRAVAKQLNLPPATLATRLAAARRALATRLTKRGVTLSGGALAGVLGSHGSAAAVPFRLADAVVRSAEAVATGTAVSSLVSAHAVQLSEGVMRMMLVTKLKAVGVATLTALALTGGLGFGLMPAHGLSGGCQPPEGAKTRGADTPRSGTPVDDVTFLNRLCLDLLGTPATALEQWFFRADADAQKRQKVVEWLVADDAVKAFLAQKLKVPVEQIHTVRVMNAADGRVVELVIVGPAELNLTNMAFSPDGTKLAVTVDGPGALVFGTAENTDAGLTGSIILNEKNFDVTTTAKLAAFQRATRVWDLVAQPADPPPALWFRAYNPYQGKLTFWQEQPPAVVEGQPFKLYLRLAEENQPKTTVTWATKPAPDTDADFLKRVLTSARGTPPTLLEEKYFAEDKDSKKREKLLDTLLKDPAVAKRLGDDWKKKMLEATPATVWMADTVRYTTRLKTYYEKMPNPFAKLVGELLAAEKSDEQILDGISLVIVGRLPTMNEKTLTLAAVGKAADRKAAWLDVAKALSGTDEAKKHAAAQKK